MMLALKSGPQIAAKIGNPAGLLCWRIWYSVVKSGVLGITEYRQGRPLNGVVELTNAPYPKYVPFTGTQCLSQDLDFFQKKELLKFFRELFAKERSYPSTAKILRMYIKCAYYMPEHIAII